MTEQVTRQEGPQGRRRGGRQGLRYGEVVAQLSAAQKPGRGAPPYSRWINRRLGRQFAAAAHLRGMTPNQITVCSAAFTFTGVACIALVSPRWWLGLLVGLLLVVGYALDAADGQLARLRGGGSIAGEWLDHVVDATKNCLLHSAVLISFYRFTDLPRWTLLIPLGYQAVSCVFFFTFILVEKLRKGAGRGIHRGAADGATGRGLAQTIVATPTDYGILCLSFLLLGWTTGFAVVYTAMFAANLVVLLLVLLRWWREMNTLTPVASA